MLFVGCYTAEMGGRGEGITAVRRDPDTGALESIGVVARTPSPSFLAWHPALPVLYAVNELPEGQVSAWAVDGTTLTPLGTASTGGAHPCHLAVAPDGRHLISANYTSGSVAVHRLADDGALGDRTDLLVHEGAGPNRERQERAHAHMVSADPAGGVVLVVDLGTDAVYRYRLVADRLVALAPPVRVPPGMGPRHLARHPDGRRAYLVGELDATVAEYELDSSGGVLHERSRVAASERPGAQPSEIAVRPDGRFVYVANRGPDTISVLALDGDTPRYVTETQTGGHWPRHFAIIDEHLYVANERAHTVIGFHLDREGGIPEEPGMVLDIPSPTCVLSV
ncbi:lactonase family protein [Actinomycetes bacterium KLBMP 9797]